MVKSFLPDFGVVKSFLPGVVEFSVGVPFLAVAAAVLLSAGEATLVAIRGVEVADLGVVVDIFDGSGDFMSSVNSVFCEDLAGLALLGLFRVRGVGGGMRFEALK